MAAFEGEALTELIKKETLALTINAKELTEAYAEAVNIEGAELGIKLKRAA